MKDKPRNKLYLSFFLLFFAGNVFAGEIVIPSDDSYFPMHEDYLPSGNTKEYIQTARQFLSLRPDSIHAPRVAYDLFMLARRSSDEKLAGEMENIIFLRYPENIYASSLFRILPKSKNKSPLEVLVNKITLPDIYSPEFLKLPEKLCRLTLARLEKTEGEISDNFAVVMYVFADIAKSERLKDKLKARIDSILEKKDNLYKDILNTCLSKELRDEEKAVKLNDSLIFLQNFYISSYLSGKPDKDKINPEIAKILILKHINANNFTKALELFESIPEELQNKDDKILLWKTICLYKSGNSAGSIGILNVLLNNSHEDEWTLKIKKLKDSIKNYDKYLGENSSVISMVFEKLNKNVDIFEIYADIISGQSNIKCSIYLNFIKSQELEFDIFINDELKFGYKTSETRSFLLLPEENKIFAFNKPIPFIAPIMNMDKNSKDGLKIKTSFAVAPSISEFENPMKSLYAGNPEIIKLFLSLFTNTNCVFPLEPLKDKNITTYEWLFPDFGNNTLNNMEYQVNGKNIVTYLKYNKIKLKSLKYGAKNEFSFEPPKWPDKEIQEVTELNNEEIVYKILSSIFTFLPLLENIY